ncbi:hypothetical protein [Alteromonas sp. CYL-A6]|uniref:hypothetical protein n=1 Tax=Alteromonas nitratireducens TaxID=3390813 RepID=UPI0034B52DE9
MIRKLFFALLVAGLCVAALWYLGIIDARHSALFVGVFAFANLIYGALANRFAAPTDEFGKPEKSLFR